MSLVKNIVFTSSYVNVGNCPNCDEYITQENSESECLYCKAIIVWTLNDK